MSQYHKHCCTSSAPPKKATWSKKTKTTLHKVIPKAIPKIVQPECKPINMVGLLNQKAFCDCRHCLCRECPDILKMLSITVSDTTCHFGSKVRPSEDIPKENEPATSKLLDVVNPERDCNCSVVARGIRDHVHMNIGMTGRREKIKKQIEICDEHCKRLAERAKGSKSVVIKDNTADAHEADEIRCQICESMARVVEDTECQNDSDNKDGK